MGFSWCCITSTKGETSGIRVESSVLVVQVKGRVLKRKSANSHMDLEYLATKSHLIAIGLNFGSQFYEVLGMKLKYPE